MNINWVDWLGYLASLIVLISLLMSSIIKLRWINLLGSLLFSTYGFMIGSLPTGLMNLGIVFINIYYLVKIYRSEDNFKLIPINKDDEYFKYFLDFYKPGIKLFTDEFSFEKQDDVVRFFILRNTVPAGIFVASKQDEKTLKVELDFVTPEYRDFKIGNYIYNNSKNYFLNKGYSKLVSVSSNEVHIQYLKKMGFEEKMENGKKYFEKSLA